ncbi:hypothetical protein [Piscinibacter gummiphilus]|jgi:bifunctional non-homologous end joining protein LigD|uniref:ATP-dependent DNA ligase family profile domain-containing protein n=1 Tax=Piscinibacter gummiphilus TaxID=946333 RepID=A0ABZ0D1T2_9BURK|nr:hypothetical protein [Piscinibacter gummiphilus]WOB11199.1 hypothetical protein RXV79_27590 [Piscinibacter gummiphilus]
MLLSVGKLPLSNESQYLCEVKADGYRGLCQFGDGAVELRTKTGANCNAWFPEIRRALLDVSGGPHVIDGEIVVQRPDGSSDFNALHARAMRRKWLKGDPPVVFAAFDVLVLGGRNVMGLGLLERKELLRGLLTPSLPSVLYVDYVEGAVSALFAWAKIKDLEGVVAKRLGSTYSPGTRSPHWLKLKHATTLGFKRAPHRPTEDF